MFQVLYELLKKICLIILHSQHFDEYLFQISVCVVYSFVIYINQGIRHTVFIQQFVVETYKEEI